MIVGVLAPGSHYATERKQDFYVNYAANDHYMSASMQDERVHRMTDVYARLAPGATPETAQTELRQIASRLHAAYPEAYPASRGLDVVVTPWKVELTARGAADPDDSARHDHPRADHRVRERRESDVDPSGAARAGNGDSRRARRVRRSLRGELLTENLLLCIVGGLLGVGLASPAWICSSPTRRGSPRAPARSARRVGAGADRRAVDRGGAALCVGAAPSVRHRSGALDGRLGRTRHGRHRPPPRPARARRQPAGGVVHAGDRRRPPDPQPDAAVRGRPGLQSRERSEPAGAGLHAPDPDRQLQFTRNLVDRVKETAAVQSVAMASSAPLAGSFPARREIRVNNTEPEAGAASPLMVTRVVSGAYFDTVGTRLKAGRTFTSTDIGTSPRVVIVSESMARFYFKGESPIGHKINLRQFNGNWSQPIEIVGVAADSRADGIERGPMHTLYQPDSQTGAQSTLLVRTAGSADTLAPQVVETIRALDPNRPIDHVQTLEEIRDETIAPQRLNATLIGLFSALALVIATVGIAGVLAFSVSQRTNELGIRLALGAERGAILRMILGEGALMAAIGLVVGGAAAIPLSRLMSGLLFGIQPVDPPTIAMAAILMMTVALIAAWVPARRATAVDPMVALRGE